VRRLAARGVRRVGAGRLAPRRAVRSVAVPAVDGAAGRGHERNHGLGAAVGADRLVQSPCARALGPLRRCALGAMGSLAVRPAALEARGGWGGVVFLVKGLPAGGEEDPPPTLDALDALVLAARHGARGRPLETMSGRAQHDFAPAAQGCRGDSDVETAFGKRERRKREVPKVLTTATLDRPSCTTKLSIYYRRALRRVSTPSRAIRSVRIRTRDPARRGRSARVAQSAEDLGHGDDVEHVVVEYRDQAIGVAVPDVVMIEARHLLARDVPGAAPAADMQFQRGEAEGGGPRLPAAARGVEEGGVPRGKSHPEAVQHSG